MTIEIMAVATKGNAYRLRKPIALTQYFEDGLYGITFDGLGIHEFGDTPDEAYNAFCSFFDTLYREYGLCNDNELTKKAQKLKRKIRSYVLEVRAA